MCRMFKVSAFLESSTYHEYSDQRHIWDFQFPVGSYTLLGSEQTCLILVLFSCLYAAAGAGGATVKF